MSFSTIGLSPDILKAISAMGFEEPTPVQAQVIPRLLENKGDMVALAQTGTGKTAAFGLPIINMIDHENTAPQALVLCPTRELCVQISRDMEAFAACSPKVRIVAIYGGAPIDAQLRKLKMGVQVIVATPGRMLDVLRRDRADLTGVQRVILDEADEMLNMGFQEDLESILAKVPDSAHTLLFSATMPRQVASIARKYMKDAEEITVGQRNSGADNVTHECYVVHQRDRYRALKRIADYYPDMYGIVFCRTRQDTQNVADWLMQDGYNADSLHGELTQTQRDRVMAKFRSKSLQILVATDVAARGLDVNDLTHVINYNLPDDLGSYTHRSGRTGRAGKSGVSVVIINMREKGQVHRIEKMINKVFEYRPVPAGADICEAQLFSMIQQMKNVKIDHKHIDKYLPKIYETLDGMERDEVIKRFVSLKFNSMLTYYRSADDLNPVVQERSTRRNDSRGNDSRPERSGRREKGRIDNLHEATSGVRMFINLGKLDGVNPMKLAKLIKSEGGKNVTLGRVDVMAKYSFFDVAGKDVAAVMQSLSMTNFKGRDVRVEPVDAGRKGKRHKRAERRKEGGRPTASPVRRFGKGRKGGNAGNAPKRKRKDS